MIGGRRPPPPRPRPARPLPSRRRGHTRCRWPQERPPREAISGADQFHHLDFRPAVQDIEADGVADHQDYGQTEERSGEPDDPAQHLEHGVESLHPFGVELYHLDVRLTSDARVFRSVPSAVLAAGVGVTIKTLGSGLASSASSALPKPEVSRKSASAWSAVMRRTSATSGRALSCFARIACALGARVLGEIDRKLERLVPVAGDGAGILQQHVQKRQRERDGDDGHGHAGRDGMLRHTAERTQERLSVAREPGLGRLILERGRTRSGHPRAGAAPGAATVPGAALAVSPLTTRPSSSTMRRAPSRRAANRSIRCASWVATTTVTPTSLKR